MSLVPDYDSSSSSEAEQNEPEEEISVQKPQIKLPPPGFIETASNSSVFNNPFKEAENEKVAVLQKHVKMVESTENLHVINGVKICWNYRKGRCRFGHNCKYAHDSDLLVEKQKGATHTIVKKEEVKGRNKRKRPGLTQGLVPGKKVLKQYVKNKKPL